MCHYAAELWHAPGEEHEFLFIFPLWALEKASEAKREEIEKYLEAELDEILNAFTVTGVGDVGIFEGRRSFEVIFCGGYRSQDEPTFGDLLLESNFGGR